MLNCFTAVVRISPSWIQKRKEVVGSRQDLCIPRFAEYHNATSAVLELGNRD